MGNDIIIAVPRVICDLKNKARSALVPRNRALFDRAATLICEFRDRASIAERMCAEMTGVLKEEHGCDYCVNRFCSCEWDPCKSCRESSGLPKWKWNGGRVYGETQ